MLHLYIIAVGLPHNGGSAAVAVAAAAAVIPRCAHHILRDDSVEALTDAVVQDLNL